MPSRTEIGWALLFSVPPGVGVTGYTTMVIGRGPLDPVAVATGGFTALVIFMLVLGAQLTGSAEDPATRERFD